MSGLYATLCVSPDPPTHNVLDGSVRDTHIALMTLATYLKLPGVTATALARHLGVAHSTVLRWADGSTQPGTERLRRLYDVTDGAVTPNDFLAPDAAA